MAIGFNPGAGRGRSNKVTARIQGLTELTNSFDRLKSKSDSFMTRQIHLAASGIAKDANRDVPVDTGKLLRSINVNKSNKMATVHVDAKYAGYVEKGTVKMRAQPYIIKHIEPRVNKMMSNIKRFITL